MRICRIVASTILTTIFLAATVSAQQVTTITVPNDKAHWVDSVYNRLNIDERIGQLFMVAAYSGSPKYNDDLITKLVAAHQVGGLIFMQGTPTAQALLTNKYQNMAQVPLLISMDAEWGLGMRLEGVKDFPRNMMLGATRDTALAYKVGMAVAYQCKRLGVHIDFAPVVDVNNNIGNPVINSRSFGENKVWVARMGIAFMRGLQENGVMACAKHFPGHGDTNTDSHLDLPVISKSMAQLDTLELYPFRQLIANGLQSVMVAHLEVPAIEATPHLPTTLSKSTITGLLKNTMKFKGLVFTDALNMQGVAKYYGPGEVDLKAFMAGNDVLLFSQDVPVAIKRFRGALDSGLITEKEIEVSVKKILGAKYNAGLANFKPIDTTNINNDINQFLVPIRTQAAKEAITLVKDDNGVLNKITRNMHVAYVGINADKETPMFNELHDSLQGLRPFWLPKGSSLPAAANMINKIADFDAVIVAVHNLSFTPGHNYGIDTAAMQFLKEAQSKTNVMIVLLGNAYALQYFSHGNSTLISYEDDSLTEGVMTKVLLRKIKAHGKLPVTPYLKDDTATAPVTVIPVVAPVVHTTTGQPNDLVRTPYAEDAGVQDKSALFNINLFLQKCVVDHVFPGCRVLAAKDGQVFYDKAFGYQAYDKKIPVDTNTVYDMASCTKVLATTLAVMRLYEKGKLGLDKTIGDYLPITKGTNKASLKIKDILLHQAGLKSWIPFYKETLDENGNLRTDLYHTTATAAYNIPVAKDLYLRNSYRDTIWNRILTSPLENKGKYVYSDLDFYFLAAIVEKITGTTIDKYVQDEFYKPLGLTHITYNPIGKLDTNTIAPTENDVIFRHEQIRATVHDQGAAMLGGVAGHAGIFATANDVAVIFQMLLNKGTYHNHRYFKTETVDYFTAYHSAISHRGLGFDKPTSDKDNGGPAGDRCSAYAFGHQGFTGTCVWADPATGVLFVFLSNRVYPSAENGQINTQNVRTLVQDYIYQALGLPVDHTRPQVYAKEVKGK